MGGPTTKTVATERRNWWALAVLLVGAFMALLDTTIVNVAIPTIRTNLGGVERHAVVDRFGLRAGLRAGFDTGRQSGGPAGTQMGVRRRLVAVHRRESGVWPGP